MGFADNRGLADDSYLRFTQKEFAVRDLLYIGVGGFFGAILRFGLSGAVHATLGSFQFPSGTLAVNLVGSFTVTALGFMAESLGVFGPGARSFLLIGLLGSFTTFSTFSLETLTLVYDGEIGLAAANVAASVGSCLVAAWLGRAAVLWIWR